MHCQYNIKILVIPKYKEMSMITYRIYNKFLPEHDLSHTIPPPKKVAPSPLYLCFLFSLCTCTIHRQYSVDNHNTSLNKSATESVSYFTISNDSIL